MGSIYRPPIRKGTHDRPTMGAEACFGEEPVRDSRFQVKQPLERVLQPAG